MTNSKYVSCKLCVPSLGFSPRESGSKPDLGRYDAQLVLTGQQREAQRQQGKSKIDIDGTAPRFLLLSAHIL